MRPALNSLAARFLVASLVLIPLFLGATGFYLDRAHRHSVELAEAQRLHALLLTLLAEADYEEQLWMPQATLEARFSQPDSGLYAQVHRRGELLWSSPSILGQALPRPRFPAALAVGGSHFQRCGPLLCYAYKVLWEDSAGAETELVFSVLEDSAPLQAELGAFRRSLAVWLGGSAIGLLFSQLLILAWSQRPLARLEADILAIEAGERRRLAGDYPREIRGLTASLNTLLDSESRRRERVQHTLADLAHSLKTPLAVIRSAEPQAPGFAELVAQQNSRMEQIVGYQLQRSIGGDHRLLQRVAVAPVVARLAAALGKVYGDKQMAIETAVPPGAMFRGDERDLLEILGNLMDNACKYGRHRVRVAASSGNAPKLRLWVEDDGPGIDHRVSRRLLQRGVRADSEVAGQGLGLAVVADIVAAYDGELDIARSCLGGARLELRFGS